jgi:hypothetical protein
MGQPPGTVSRILWHFTGGPSWNSAENRQANRPKPAKQAYEALVSILKSKELLLGGYREVVRVHVPKLRRYNKSLRKMEELKNTMVQMSSSPVCCLSDIPIAHLSYHAKRYGKMAIGFHRKPAVRHGFNPVFYTLHKSEVLRSMRLAFVKLRRAKTNSIDSVAAVIETAIRDLEDIGDDDDRYVERDLDRAVDDLRDESLDIGNAISESQEGFAKFLAFVKTFDQKEFSSIYCEREWRSTKRFSFKADDLAMVVLPKGDKAMSYFNDFVNKRRALNLARSIPVIAWEDLIEH